MTSSPSAVRYWLLKTEPDAFSFDDLIACAGHTDTWDGIRNYQARNFMRDTMAVGHEVFIYHSRIKEPAIVGTAAITSEAVPDDSALDPSEKYFDAKSAEKGESRWVMRNVTARQRFAEPITLGSLREYHERELAALPLLQKGQRLSIQPVPDDCWRFILSLSPLVPLL